MTDKRISAAQDPGFADIAQLIAAAKQRAVQAVNTSLIELYWQIGQRISQKIAAAEWGDGVVDNPTGQTIAAGDTVQYIAFSELLS